LALERKKTIEKNEKINEKYGKQSSIRSEMYKIDMIKPK
jgi:hypothetical protein